MSRGTLPALLLAAGQSSRMQGGHKLLLPWKGRSLLRHAFEVLHAGACNPVITILGAEAERLRRELPPQAHALVNENHAAGMASSIVLGIKHIPAGSEGAVIALADMPFVSPQLVQRLCALFFANRAEKIIVPEHAGRRGNPVVFPQRFFDELLTLQGDQGARRVITAHSREVALCPVDDATVFADIDTREAYEQALRPGSTGE